MFESKAMIKMEKIKLLIADDNENLRKDLVNYFGSQNFIDVVAEAVNGIEAISLAREYKPDVIIMDISMPLMNGLKATQTIKEEMPSIDIMALTVHDEEEYRIEFEKFGATGYFLKGTPLSDLLTVIKYRNNFLVGRR